MERTLRNLQRGLLESVNDDGPTKVRILNFLIILEEKMVADLHGNGFLSA